MANDEQKRKIILSMVAARSQGELGERHSEMFDKLEKAGEVSRLVPDYQELLHEGEQTKLEFENPPSAGVFLPGMEMMSGPGAFAGGQEAFDSVTNKIPGVRAAKAGVSAGIEAAEGAGTVIADPAEAASGFASGVVRKPGEEGESDASSIGRSLGEGSFRAAGAIAGEAIGGVPGAALLAAGGEGIQQTVARVAGGEAPESATEAAVEMGKASVEGALVGVAPKLMRMASGKGINLAAQFNGLSDAPGVIERAIARPGTAAVNVGVGSRSSIQAEVTSGIRAIQKLASEMRTRVGKRVGKEIDRLVEVSEGQSIVEVDSVLASAKALQERVGRKLPKRISGFIEEFEGATAAEGSTLGSSAGRKIPAKRAKQILDELDDLVKWQNGGLQPPILSSEIDQKAAMEVGRALRSSLGESAKAETGTALSSASKAFQKFAFAFEKLGFQVGTKKDSAEAFKTVGKKLGRTLGESGEVLAELEAAASDIPGSSLILDELFDNLTRLALSGSTTYTPSSVAMTGIRSAVTPATIAALARMGTIGQQVAKLLAAPALAGSKAGDLLDAPVRGAVKMAKEALGDEETK